MYDDDMKYVQENMGFSPAEVAQLKKKIDMHDKRPIVFEWDSHLEQ